MIWFLLSVISALPFTCMNQACTTVKTCLHSGKFNTKTCTCECYPAYKGMLNLKTIIEKIYFNISI